MLFNSLEFLLFFPIVTIIYFLLPYKFRGPLLLVASCVFYAGFIPGYLLILLFLITIDYWAGVTIEASEGRSRLRYLLVSIGANIGMLFFFKYFNFFSENLTGLLQFFQSGITIPHLDILLPLGLSFHVFQSLSYTIEVYRKRVAAERSFLTFALYVMFYPQLVAGPIERPWRLLPQLHFRYDFDYATTVSGLRLMAWGFFKKVIIADRAAIVVDLVYKNPEQYQGPMLMLATALFAYQLYCDFSGYTDIARGAARVMGIHLVPNFNFPLAAVSMTDFWRRWHISLSSWFRDYVYIPLGGSRTTLVHQSFNLIVTFLLSGLWHGANWTFVIWGTLHGLAVSIEVLTRKYLTGIFIDIPLIVRKYAGHTYVFGFWCFSLIFFRANSLEQALYIVTHLFDGSANFIMHVFDKAYVKSVLLIAPYRNDYLVLLVSIFFLEGVQWFVRHHSIEKLFFRRSPTYLRWIVYGIALWTMLIYGIFSSRQFIYFAF